MAETNKKVLTGPMIEIKGSLPRHLIVKKVVTTFIKTEYLKKGRGIAFRYPVETLPDNQILYISRPGHKKNFDFKVEVVENHGIGEGSHKEIAKDLRRKERENPQAYNVFWEALTQIYNSRENDVDVILKKQQHSKTYSKKVGIRRRS